MTESRDILNGIDAGTSVIKAVAFDLGGRQLASAAVRNTNETGADGAATQPLARTWADCATALRGLGEKIDHLPQRCKAISVTAQGDGTWLIDGAGTPVSLAYVYMVMTALGAGVDTGDASAACSTEGSTGVHMRAVMADRVHLNVKGTGYVICLPIPGMAARDCHGAMRAMFSELRPTGGAARSKALREVLAGALGAPVRVSFREEAGVAMMAAVAIGAYYMMVACVGDWVTPLLGEAEIPDAGLVGANGSLFSNYQSSRRAGLSSTDRSGGSD